MKKSTKIIISVFSGIILLGSAVGAYFMFKPKEGDEKEKDGKKYKYVDGKWTEISIITVNQQLKDTSVSQNQIPKGNTISENKTVVPPVVTKQVKTLLVQPEVNLGLWTTSDNVIRYDEKIVNGEKTVDINAKSKYSVDDLYIGVVNGFKTLDYGTYGKMSLIRVLSKGKYFYVYNEGNVISKKTIES